MAPMSILTFCLNEILLRTLMGNDSILSCLTHIIVDGVDENDRFCDLLLLVLSEALTRYKMLKLIILSHADSPNAFKYVKWKKKCLEANHSLEFVGYHFSSRLTATLNLSLIYLKLLVHVL